MPTFGSCKKTFSSGSGATRFSWCFTTEGSVSNLEGPAGVLNMGFTMEGFCLASDNLPALRYASAPSGEQGLQPPTYPNANSVQHKTTDNAFIITQTFAQTTATKTVTVTMKVQNVSGITRSVRLARLADLLPGGFFNTVQIQTARSVIDTEPGAASVVMAAATNAGLVSTMTIPFASPAAGITTDLLDGACNNSAGDAEIGPTTFDSLAAIRYSLGSVPNNASVTVKFTYQLIY